MKLLHTSDWHLGQILYGYDRTDEYIHFFNKLKEIVRWERPDAFLMSGDIFDVSNPSSAIMRLFKDNILDLKRLFPDMAIIITAGNHDSASRVDIDRNLWKQAGIDVIGSVGRKNGRLDFSTVMVKIGDKGYVVALPYLNRFILSSGQDDKSGRLNIFQSIEEYLKETNDEDLPVVLMAHLTVADCDREGHRQTPIGGIDSIDRSELGSLFDYVALGHIHKMQKFDSGRIVYSGSPLAVSFDENYPHTVSIVNIEKGVNPMSEEIPVEPLRALKTIPSEGVTFSKALKILGKLPDEDNSYIRLNVCQPDSLPSDCIEQAVIRTKGKNCRFCTFRYVQEGGEIKSELLPQLHISELKEMTPSDIADSFFRSIGTDEEKRKRYIEMILKLEGELEDEEK